MAFSRHGLCTGMAHVVTAPQRCATTSFLYYFYVMLCILFIQLWHRRDARRLPLILFLCYIMYIIYLVMASQRCAATSFSIIFMLYYSYYLFSYGTAEMRGDFLGFLKTELRNDSSTAPSTGGTPSIGGSCSGRCAERGAMKLWPMQPWPVQVWPV